MSPIDEAPPRVAGRSTTTGPSDALPVQTDSDHGAVDDHFQLEREEAGPSGVDPGGRAYELDYPGKDDSVVGQPDPLIVGPPTNVAADAGEGGEPAS